MPVDPVIHAHMAYLLQREKKQRADANQLEEEIEVWKKRVRLADQRGMGELADQARERARELIARRRKLEDEFELIATEKKMLRSESLRPGGQEVARAEELLRRWQESGLVDGDQAVLAREFDQLNADQALAELRQAMGEEPGDAALDGLAADSDAAVVFPEFDALSEGHADPTPDDGAPDQDAPEE